MRILETARLNLRVFAISDLDEFAAIEADPDVMRFYSSGPRTRQHAERGIRWFIDCQNRTGYSLWAVERKSDLRMLGYCGLIDQKIDDQREVEIGYKLAKDVWGQGLATEAAIAAKNWGFDNLAVDHLISIIDPLNAASIRVAVKNGMRPVKSSEYAGKLCTIFWVDRGEWPEQRGT
jgi:ribosomal-protein-alanine N-acetyltransferase